MKLKMENSGNGTFDLYVFDIKTKKLLDCLVEEINMTYSFFEG